MELTDELRKVGEDVGQVAEDLEVLRHLLFLGRNQLPGAGDRIDGATVAAFVEALIETSQAIGPYLLRKRAATSVAKNLKLYDFREQFESADARLSGRKGPIIGRPRQTTVVGGFYHQRTDSIHLPPDAKFADALHEGIHKYSSVVVRMRLGEYVNEGLTQHFTDLVRAEHGVKGRHEHAYGDRLACANKVIGWLDDGERLSRRAYFRGDIEPLRQEIMRRLRVNGSQLDGLARDRGGEGLCERIMESP